MKTVKIFSLVAVLFAVALASVAFINNRNIRKPIADNKGFAVIELFTSEGCSSCPPADALVAKIQQESKDKPVYILAYHVDYWDRLGWKDQFSSADFSKRQYEYTTYLKTQGPYTPQIVVNGKTEFVGSQEGTLRDAIGKALKKNSDTQVSLNVAAINSKQAELKYTMSGGDKNTVLEVAAVEKAATSKVASGENGGRTLSHVQIVRSLQQVALTDAAGSATILLPAGFDAKSWEIIGFLQNRKSGAITGATKATLAAGTNPTAAVKN
ncbi:MAG: DUF1223 domain-containing protein [Bacteroidota bacterium]|nr:DUF1223 domain-containing protein [Bacteroidota bacterium]